MGFEDGADEVWDRLSREFVREEMGERASGEETLVRLFLSSFVLLRPRPSLLLSLPTVF